MSVWEPLSQLRREESGVASPPPEGLLEWGLASSEIAALSLSVSCFSLSGLHYVCLFACLPRPLDLIFIVEGGID